MEQSPLINSDIQSPKTSRLKPVLASALASLEVQLDQELTRYRRTRNGIRKPQPQEFPPEHLPPTEETSQDQDPPHQETPQIDTSLPPLTTDSNDATLPISNRSLVHKNINHNSTSDSPNHQQQLAPTIATNDTFLPAENAPKPPDDYLESSEALLRSLASESTRTSKPTQPTSHNHDSLLSPLGISSIFLLLMSSLILGYVVFNPQNLPRLDLAKLLNLNFFTSSADQPVVDNQPAAKVEPELTPIGKYPNLATHEFPNLRDPSDVVNLEPKLEPKPVPLPPPTLSGPITVSPPIQPIAPIKPVPHIEPFSPSQQAQQANISLLNRKIQPSADGLYHVIAENQGKGTLSAARKVVRDAYLSPNKKYIYLGASKTKQEAQRRIQQLESKGIKARLQQS